MTDCQDSAAPSQTRVAIIPLLVALSIMLGISIWPRSLTRTDGQADHIAAVLLFWAMSAGFVRGVGFIPQHKIFRWLLSGTACGVTVAFACSRMMSS